MINDKSHKRASTEENKVRLVLICSFQTFFAASFAFAAIAVSSSVSNCRSFINNLPAPQG